MKNITFEAMLNMEIQDLLNGYPSGGRTYYYRNGEGEYHEIIELDLLRGRFITDDGDFSEFDWELEESHVYIEEEQHDINDGCTGCLFENVDDTTDAICNCVCCNRISECAKHDYYTKK